MFIDIHAHIGRIRPHPDATLDLEDLLRKMDAWGIDLACVLALGDHANPHYQDNDSECVLAACRQFPDRLVPFGLVVPEASGIPPVDQRRRLAELRARGCQGVGEFLPDLPFDAPACLAIYRLAGEFGLPVLFDLHDVAGEYGLRDAPGLPGLERALQACPETVFIGHGPTFWAEISGNVAPADRAGYPYPSGPITPGGAVPRLLAAYSNLWADLSAGSGYHALTRDPGAALDFVRAFQDRLLFGTDSCRRFAVEPVSPIRELMRHWRDSGLLDAAVCAKIEGANATRLLGL